MNFNPSKSPSNEVRLERGAKHCMTQKDEAVMFRQSLVSLPTLARPGNETMSLNSTAVREDNRNPDPSRRRTWLSRRVFSWCITSLTTATGLLSALSVQAQEPQPDPGAGNSQYTLPYSDISGSAGEYSAYSGYDKGGYGSSGYQNSNNVFSIPEEPDVVGGMGIKARAVHEAGQTVGRTQSITSFDLSPYVFVEDWILFGEGRLAVGNNGKAAGSLGAGARHYFSRLDSILGVSGWYDADASRGPTFQQWGISGEAFSQFLDVRANYYVPFGEIYKITGQQFEPGSQRFVDATDINGNPFGTNLVFQRRTFTATAMKGFDTLFSVPVPGTLAQNLNLEASAGFYHYFVQDNSVDDVWGWRLRLDMDVAERLSHMFLEVMHDKTFKTNVVFGIDINYWHNLGHRQRIGHSQHARLAEWVRRNRTVVAFEGSFLEDPETAINPRTNLPYIFLQVNSDTSGGVGLEDGTLENPFRDLQAAIDAAGLASTDPDRTSAGATAADVVFVQGNSVFNTGVTIPTEFLQVIGEQVNPTVQLPVAGLNGNVLLPTITPGLFNTPTIRGVVDTPAVTLAANNVRFAAMNIEDVTFTNPIVAGDYSQSAIYAANQSFSSNSFILNTLDTVSIDGVENGHGISLVNIGGRMDMNNVSVSNVDGNMFSVIGGNAIMAFTGSSNNFINGATAPVTNHGYAVRIDDFSGSLNMQNVLIQDTAGMGIRIEDSSVLPIRNPTITFGEIELNGSNPIAGEGDIYINNLAGSVNFLSNVTIDQSSGTASQGAIFIRNLQSAGNTSSGVVAFSGTTTINDRLGRGVYVLRENDPAAGTRGQVLFNGPVTINDPTRLIDGAAIEFDSYADTLQFGGQVDINGGNGDGIYVRQTGGTSTSLGSQFVANRAINISNMRNISFRVEDVASTNSLVSFAQQGSLNISNRGIAGLPVDNNLPANQDRGIAVLFSTFEGQARIGGPVTISNGLGSFATPVRIERNYANGVDSTNTIAFTGGFNVSGVLGTATSNTTGILVQDNGGGGISLGSVNVAGNLATGVILEDNYRVAVSGGTIAMTNGSGIIVREATGLVPSPSAPQFQTHEITLASVSATNADYGILVQNSQGNFTVAGGTANGGTISGMTVAAASFQNTLMTDPDTVFNVSLSGMQMTGNAQGVVMSDVNGEISSLFLDNMSIRTSAGRGILADNVRTMTLQNSLLNSNGVTAQTEQVEVIARGGTSANAYSVTMTNNSVTDGLTPITNGRSMINIHTSNTAASDPTLTLNFSNNGTPGTNTTNTITSTRSNGASALLVNWNGDAQASIINNTFQIGPGTNQTGVNVNVDGGGSLTYTGNSVTTAGSGATGLNVLFTETADILISGNGSIADDGTTLVGFLSSGLGSTGIAITSLGTNSNIEVSDNLIQFNTTAYGGTGVQFGQVFGTNGDTNVDISGNIIQLAGLSTNGGGNVVSQQIGFNFSNVRGVISLSGANDNTVNSTGNQTLFFPVLGINGSNTNGTFSVNGVARP